jgi:hypothetical protein
MAESQALARTTMAQIAGSQLGAIRRVGNLEIKQFSLCIGKRRRVDA